MCSIDTIVGNGPQLNGVGLDYFGAANDGKGIFSNNIVAQFGSGTAGEDFEVYKDVTKGNRITGVYSKSDKEPLKKSGFPEQYQEFENKMAYNEWKFVYTIPMATTPRQRDRLAPGSAVPAGRSFDIAEIA